MAMLRVSRKEFQKGWSRALQVVRNADGQLTNAHRLLLFYAVENGLKAIVMATEKIRDGEASFVAESHDLNALLDRLRVKRSLDLHLESTIMLVTRQGEQQRNIHASALNQVWRYGCAASKPSDSELEQKLNRLVDWIEGRLE